MKVIFTGKEDSGKSYLMAVQAYEIVYRNSRWYNRTGVKRPIYSSLYFSKEFVKWAEDMNVPIFYWHSLAEIQGLRDADLFIDEIGTYFDSRLWTDLSLSMRRWLAQTSKVGVDIYGTAQDFAQVDKAFRRLVSELWHVVKIVGSRRPSPTKPPVKRIWGVCSKERLNPDAYEEDNKKSLSFMRIPSLFFLRKKYALTFDTTQIQKQSPPLPLEHVERLCPTCGKVEVRHR